MTLDDVLALAEPEPNSGCWLYSGKVDRGGYGPHRRIWRGLGRSIPAQHDLDHRCGVRSCINPAHLEPVSRSENQIRAADRRLEPNETPAQRYARHWRRVMRGLPY
jgi:hypothetical protein